MESNVLRRASFDPVPAKGRVLIIESDEWLGALLRKFLGDAGFEVALATGAKEGFDKVRELAPDCILCDVNLPDIDGFWVARRVRTEPSAVSTTPFLFLTEADDVESRLQGLHVGADLYMTKPLRNEEVVAQVTALIDMANRLKKQRDAFSSESPTSNRGSAFQGDISQVSLSTVLTLLELERRSGRLKVKSDGRRGEIDLQEGTLVAASLGGKLGDARELLRELLRWKRGSFAFKPSLDSPKKPLVRQNLGGLLLEAMRLEDESQR
jgi:two-component system, OmpR family, response regulator